MNTKIHKLLVFILATSSALSPIASYAMPAGVEENIGVIMGAGAQDVVELKDVKSKFIYDIKGPHPYKSPLTGLGGFNPDKKSFDLKEYSGFTLVFGGKHNLKISSGSC